MLTSEYLLSQEWYAKLAEMFAARDAALAEAMFDIFSSVLSSDELMLFHFKKGARPDIIKHRMHNSARERQIDEYRRGFYLLDPFYLALERASRIGALSLTDVVEDSAFHESEFYRHHYHETGIVDELCYCMSDGNGGHLLLSFARSVAMARYHPTQIALAKSLSPIVLLALSNSWKSLVDPSALGPPSSEEVRLHQDLQKARNNFGRSILTAREFEVVQLMLRGYSIGVIAKRLDMAQGTTKVHRRNIYRKLDIGSQAELFSLFIAVAGAAKVLFDQEDPLVAYNSRTLARSGARSVRRTSAEILSQPN